MNLAYLESTAGAQQVQGLRRWWHVRAQAGAHPVHGLPLREGRAADAQEKAAAALEKAAAALGAAAALEMSETALGSASASGRTGGDAGVWRVYLCALLLVLNHAILKTKARAEEGERWAHPLGGLSFPFCR